MNGWRIVALTIGIILTFSGLCVLIVAHRVSEAEGPPGARFKIEEHSRGITVITDTKTGAEYLYYKVLGGAGLCQLEE